MKPFLDSVMSQIKLGLQGRGYVTNILLFDYALTLHSRKNAPSEEPIFQCIGMLASAVGPNLTKLLHDQLDLMLACGLSEPLVQALAAIVKFISPLLKTIQGVSVHVDSNVEVQLKIARSPAGSPIQPS